VWQFKQLCVVLFLRRFLPGSGKSAWVRVSVRGRWNSPVVGINGELKVHDLTLELKGLVLVAVHDGEKRNRPEVICCGPFE